MWPLYFSLVLNLWDNGLHVVYILKYSSADALGGVSNVATFIIVDEQFQ